MPPLHVRQNRRMNLLDWIQTKIPGSETRLRDRLEIAHQDGSHSTLWYRTEADIPKGLPKLIYDEFDGIDLFSSTFKIAALKKAKSENGVEIVFSLDSINREFSDQVDIPPGSTIFMHQAGIGIYAAFPETDEIIEWDTEMQEITGRYSDLLDILNEWYNAVKEPEEA